MVWPVCSPGACASRPRGPQRQSAAYPAGEGGKASRSRPQVERPTRLFSKLGRHNSRMASPCRGGATPWGFPSGDPEAKAASGSVEFCVNEQFCTDQIDPRANHSPIKSRHSRWLRPEARRGVNGDGLCTNHSAIAIMRQNLCGRLNKRAITFAARFISLWPCLGSLSPVRMKRPARERTRMRAAAGSPHAGAANERRPPIKATRGRRNLEAFHA
jgi:hypothetical protein